MARVMGGRNTEARTKEIKQNCEDNKEGPLIERNSRGGKSCFLEEEMQEVRCREGAFASCLERNGGGAP